MGNKLAKIVKALKGHRGDALIITPPLAVVAVLAATGQVIPAALATMAAAGGVAGVKTISMPPGMDDSRPLRRPFGRRPTQLVGYDSPDQSYEFGKSRSHKAQRYDGEIKSTPPPDGRPAATPETPVAGPPPVQDSGQLTPPESASRKKWT